MGTRGDLAPHRAVELPETGDPDGEEHGGDDRDEFGQEQRVMAGGGLPADRPLEDQHADG
jgi:hypothetical protein